MAISIAKTIKEERLRWILPVAQGEIKLVAAAKVCPYSKRSLERWLAAYKRGGEEALGPKSTNPKTNPQETSIRVKELVIAKRKKLKQCAQKLHWQLALEGTMIPVRTNGRTIASHQPGIIL